MKYLHKKYLALQASTSWLTLKYSGGVVGQDVHQNETECMKFKMIMEMYFYENVKYNITVLGQLELCDL